MFAWIGELTGQERKTLIATYGGRSVDAFDFIYNFVPRRRRIFHRAVSSRLRGSGQGLRTTSAVASVRLFRRWWFHVRDHAAGRGDRPVCRHCLRGGDHRSGAVAKQLAVYD